MGLPIALVVYLSAGAGVAQMEPSFDFLLDAPARVAGAPGSTVRFPATGRLATRGLLPGDEGALGWTCGLAATGCEIVDITTAGTDAIELFSNGFEVTRLVDPALNNGVRGAVTTMVLSFVPIVWLPVDPPQSIFRLALEGPVPAASCGSCEVRFVDGLRVTSRPVDNTVTYTGETVRPTLEEARIEICGGGDAAFLRGDYNQTGEVTAGDMVALVRRLFQEGPGFPCEDAGDASDDGALNLVDAITIAEYLFLGGPPLPPPFPDVGPDITDDALLCFSYDPVPPPRDDRFALAIADFDLDGPAGGVLSLTAPEAVAGVTAAIRHDPALLEIRGAELAAALASTGIEFFSVVLFPDGITIGLVADLVAPLEGQLIPPGQNLPVVTLDYRARAPASDPRTTRLEFADGALGDPPIRNLVVTAGGGEIAPVLLGGTVRIPPDRGLRVPGDCNGDGSLDISDAACVLGFIFLDRPSRLPCGDGTATAPGNVTLLDWQGDGEIDIGDGVATLLALFAGGPPHPLAGVGRDTGGCVPVPDCFSIAACR